MDDQTVHSSVVAVIIIETIVLLAIFNKGSIQWKRNSGDLKMPALRK